MKDKLHEFWCKATIVRKEKSPTLRKTRWNNASNTAYQHIQKKNTEKAAEALLYFVYRRLTSSLLL